VAEVEAVLAGEVDARQVPVADELGDVVSSSDILVMSIRIRRMAFSPASDPKIRFRSEARRSRSS
jgi:hypothetical protein